MEGSNDRREHPSGSAGGGEAPSWDPGGPFRRVVERGADGVAILDESGVIVYANPAASALLGRPPLELLGRPLGLPVVPFQSAEIDVPGPGGAPGRVVELRAAEAAWEGRPAVVVGLRDVTAYRRLAEGQRFLAEAGAELARSLELPETLERIARLAVEQLADACLIDLVGPDGVVRRRVARHAGADEEALLAPLLGEAPVDPTLPSGLPRALRTGRPKLYSRATESALDSLAVDPAHRDRLRRLGVGSLMILPLVAHDRILGALTLLTTRPGRYFAATDMPTANELATLAALALDNVRLYDESREAVRRRDEFLAMLSHELRNPMASIVHAVELLRDGVGVDAGRRAAVEVIARQAQQMGRLLDDLLDISRVTRGIIRLERARIDLLDVLERALEAARPTIEAAGHRLRLDLPGGPLPVFGDPTRLAQALVNLLTNAARYTPPGGHIALAVEAAPLAVEVVVRDDGIGIEPELLPRIFDLFTQGRRGLDRAHGGLGIGLTLVKEIVELHEGSISAASDGPGRGSTFRLRLPSAEPPDAAAIAPAPASAGAAIAAGPGALRILIVEDHDDNREMLRTLLTLCGHHVEAVADGLEALDALRRRPDLALIDLGLPGLDGLSLARAARSDPALADLTLIAVTGYARAEDRAEALEAGFDDHLPKPVRIDELKRLIARLGRPAPRGRGGPAG